MALLRHFWKEYIEKGLSKAYGHQHVKKNYRYRWYGGKCDKDGQSYRCYMMAEISVI